MPSGQMSKWRGTAPVIHNLINRWRVMVSFKPQLLYKQGKRCPVPSEQAAGWVPELGWALWTAINLSLAGHQTTILQLSSSEPIHYNDSAIPAQSNNQEVFKFETCSETPSGCSVTYSCMTHTSLLFFNWINQQDAKNSQVYYLSFKYSSTCFGHPRAHHQELQQLQ